MQVVQYSNQPAILLSVILLKTVKYQKKMSTAWSLLHEVNIAGNVQHNAHIHKATMRLTESNKELTI
jgi:hypothetical protein